jgi:nitrite reductase/ring-hydroxylating ferredoxin subunit
MPETGPGAGPAASADGLPLCQSADLSEKGLAVVFDVLHYREPARAFALRFDGKVVAYLNRCAHVPAELDWQPGDFLDSSKAFILCSIHGAAYEPRSGRCAGGPCGRIGLTVIDVAERDGQVYWYPSPATHPPLPIDAAAQRPCLKGRKPP